MRVSFFKEKNPEDLIIQAVNRRQRRNLPYEQIADYEEFTDCQSNTTSVQGPANLASLTFFSNRRSLFFISLLYFSDSLLICSMRTLTEASAGFLSSLR